MYCLCRRRRVGFAPIACLTTWVAVLAAAAQPGTLDPGFLANVAGTGGGVRALAPLPDGRLLIAGQFSTVDGFSQAGLARLQTNGVRDSTFTGPTGQLLEALTIDTSNRVLVMGWMTNSTGSFYIARLTTDGAVDTSFSGTIQGQVFCAVAQAGGKLLVGGFFQRMLEDGVLVPRNRITRLNEDGSDDQVFASTNRGANGAVNDLVRQPDGKILVAGNFSTFDGEARAGIVRLNADTTLDPGFNCSVPGGVYQVALQADGKVVIAGGFSTVNGVNRPRVARVNEDGSLDATLEAAVEPLFTGVRSVALDSTGRIYIGGSFTWVSGTTRNYFARLHSDGVLDTGFDPGLGPNAMVNRVAVLPTDDVVIGGSFGAYNGVTAGRVARVRGGASIPSAPAIRTHLGNRTVTAGNFLTLTVRATGSPRLDYYWYHNGTHLPGQRGETWQTNYTLPQHAGTYTVIVSNELGTAGSQATVTVNSAPPGFTRHPTNQTALLGQRVTFRSEATGAPSPTIRWQLNDTEIGSGSQLVLTNVTYAHAGNYRAIASNAVGMATGVVATLTVNAPAANAGAVDLSFYPVMASGFGGASSAVVQPDGKVIVAFGGYPGANGTWIRRLNSDGSLDTSFNTNATADGQVASMALQSDGRLLIGGSFPRVNGTNRYQLARLRPDGQIDSEFAPLLNTWSIKYLAVQPDGKILVAGDLSSANRDQNLILGRLLPDGSDDPNFKDLVRIVTPGAFAASVGVAGMAVQSDGKILLSSSLGLQRFLPHGSIDTGFSVTNPPLSYRSIAVARDGKILAARGPDQARRVEGLNADGTVDATYVSAVTNSVQTITLQPDGKALITVDTGLFAAASQLAVRRLNTDGSIDSSFDSPTGGTLITQIPRILLKESGEILVIGNFDDYNRYFRPGIVQLLNDPPRAPEITRQPSAVGIYEGQTAAFSVEVTCPPQPFYEWRRNDVVIAGADGPLLRLVNTRLSDAGSYTVVISNSMGSVTSAPAALVVNAAPTNAGAVDVWFGTGSGPNDTVYAAVKQPDGRIVIGGLFSEVDGVPRSRVARLNADGSLDMTFDPGDGAAGLLVPEVRALALQGDGKVVVGGRFATFGDRGRNHVARLNSDGTVDISFVGEGSTASEVYALAVQPDGKVVCGSGSGRRIERFNTNGMRDLTFNASGPGAFQGNVYALLVEPDGKIVCGGDVTVFNGVPVGGFWRLRTNGLVDAALDTWWTRLGITYSVQARPDGYLLGGTFEAQRTNGVLRLQTNGAFAPFWTLPRITAPVYAAAMDDCDRVVIGGAFREVNGMPARGLARLTGYGNVEPSFAPGPMTDGYVRVVLPLGGARYLVAGDFSEINGVARPGVAQIIEQVEGPPLITASPTNGSSLAGQDVSMTATVDCAVHTSYQWTRDGIAVNGATNATLEFQNARPVVNGEYRLIASNALGATTSGVVTVALTMPPTMPGRNDIDFYPGLTNVGPVRALAVQPDGKVLAGRGSPSRSLLRLNPDGSVDTSFAVTNFIASPEVILVQPNGEIMLGGISQILRLNSDGTHDVSFAVPSGYAARDLVMRPEGKYIFAGTVPSGGASMPAVRRLFADGRVDPSFMAPRPDGSVNAVAVRNNGKVLVGGSFSYWTSNATQMYWSSLAQFNTNGSLDADFVSLFAGDPDSVLAIAVEPEGTVLAGGSFTTYDQRPRHALVRLFDDGTADPTFNPPLSNSVVVAIALQPDGKIVIAGTGTNDSILAGRSIARLHRDGTVDTGFDAGLGARRNGITVAILALANGSSGKIYAGGNFGHYDGFARPFVARVHGDPEILGPAYTGAIFKTSIYTDAGRTYHLESAVSPKAASWMVLQSLNGNAAVQNFTDSTATGATRFYRIRVE
jgi:uncharacterized delta-60 repeat protein